MAEETENQENTENTENSETSEPETDQRLETRKKKSESRRQQAVLRTGLILGIIVLVNIISINLFYRLDLTSNKLYTLSDASKGLVKNLDDKLVVKSYFTDNLPAPYNNTRRYLKEILDDYRNYSNGNFEYEIISPSDELKLEEDAQRYGIQPVQVQTYKDDRAEAMKAYMGLVFNYAGKQEILPFIGNTQNLEYEITGTIKRLIEPELKKVGILQGVSGMPGTDKIGKITQYLSKYYNITNVDASKNTPVPNDVKVLIVMTPKAAQQNMAFGQQQAAMPSTIPENIKLMIDQYIMNGGRVIFLMNKVSMSQQQQFQFAQVLGTGLEDMMDFWGIRMNNTVVKDKECATINVPVQGGPFQMYTQIPFPYFPKITNINRNLPAFSSINQVYLSFTSDIDTSMAGLKGLKTDPLLITSNKTGVDKEISIVQTTGQLPPDSIFKMSNLVVGAVFSGKFNSFYKDKQIPADTAGGSQPVMTAIKDQSPDTKVIVIGNGDFPTDEFKAPDENLAFFASLIDYMADDIGLSEIRGKDANPSSLKPMDESLRKIIKWGLMAVPPAIVLLYGVFRWKKRKSAKGE